MREGLTACLRCEVDTSPKPEYGFELALKKKYDLFIFDFQMPMIDGSMLFFLIGKVYNNREPPQNLPPLLLASGKADEERAQDLLKEPGVAGLVAKPFAMSPGACASSGWLPSTAIASCSPRPFADISHSHVLIDGPAC